MALRITVPRSPLAQAALVLLLVSAFGSLTVGLPLLTAGLRPEELWLPVVATAWGVLSLVGAYGVWRARPWAPWVIIPSQGLIAGALLWAWAAFARDWSVLLVSAIAAGPAILVGIQEARRRRRSR